MKEELHQAAEILVKSKFVVVSTGAGISKESGIPTFRETQTGIWANFNPEELATVDGFVKNPGLVWNWYQDRIKMIANVEPNPGHFAIAKMQDLFDNFTLITQNIDNLHKKAGSRDICELHGNILEFKCFEEGSLIDKLPDTTDIPPRCPHCNAMIRPNVVWFGEALPEKQLSLAYEKSEKCDCMLVVGTSGLVQPAASLPFIAKRSSDAKIIEVNPTPSAITSVADVYLQGKSGEILPDLVRAVIELQTVDE